MDPKVQHRRNPLSLFFLCLLALARPSERQGL